MNTEKNTELNLEKDSEAKAKQYKRSVIYENIDLKVETVDKIILGLFIVIVVIFGYAVMS